MNIGSENIILHSIIVRSFWQRDRSFLFLCRTRNLERRQNITKLDIVTKEFSELFDADFDINIFIVLWKKMLSESFDVYLKETSFAVRSFTIDLLKRLRQNTTSETNKTLFSILRFSLYTSSRFLSYQCIRLCHDRKSEKRISMFLSDFHLMLK